MVTRPYGDSFVSIVLTIEACLITELPSTSVHCERTLSRLQEVPCDSLGQHKACPDRGLACLGSVLLQFAGI
jgi:hypothetical protein